MCVISHRRDLLYVRVFVSDHVNKTIFQVGIEPGGRAERLESDLYAGDRTAHTHGLSTTHRDRHRRKSGFRIELTEFVQGGFETLTYLGAYFEAGFCTLVDFGLSGQG